MRLSGAPAAQARRAIFLALVLAAVISAALTAFLGRPADQAAGSNAGKVGAQVQATPTPTPTPAPVTGLYRNTTEGFSLQIPSGWQGKTSDPPTVLRVLDKQTSPTVILEVWLFRLSKTQSARDWVAGQLANYAAGFTPVDGQAVAATPGTTAHQMTIDYTNAGNNSFREIWTAYGRGTQMIMVRAIMAPSTYSGVAVVLTQVFSSFKFEVPTPFGASQSDSLFLLGGQIRTIDPALFRGSAEGIVGALFNGLVALNRNLEVVPAVAAAWDIDETGTIYTFHINPDARFHDGSPITANDVKYSFERTADPATDSPTARTYLGDIVGVDEMAAGEATEISGLEVIDDLTLRVTIDSPKAYFVQKLTYPTAYIVDRRNVETGEDWTKTPNGSGRFKLKVWVEDDLLILERFDDHHLGVPKLKHIVYRLFAGRAMTMYENGEIDITGVSGFNIERVTDPQNPLNQDLVIGVGMCTSYVFFNSSAAPFDDINVRRAFAQALDLETLLEVTRKGYADPAYSILPPGIPGHIPDRFKVQYDPAGALRLLRESDYYKSGFFSEPLLSYSGGDAYHWMWQSNLGVDIFDVSLPDSDDWLKRRDAGEFGFGITGWCADYPDPQNFLEILFHSDSDENTIGYSNPDVDALLDRAGVEPDHETRMGLYADAEELILADWVVIPVSYSRSYVLVKPYVQNYALSPIGVQIYHELEIAR